MSLNRRNVLRSSAIVPALVVGGVTGQLATCGANGLQINPAVLDSIMKAVAAGCNFIPSVETIIALVGASFPAVAAATTITDTVLSQIAGVFCAHAPVSSEKLRGATLGGTNIVAHGWVVGPDGKLTYV